MASNKMRVSTPFEMKIRDIQQEFGRFGIRISKTAAADMVGGLPFIFNARGKRLKFDPTQVKLELL